VARQDKKHSEETARNFHKILKVLLKPLLDVQEDGIPNFSIVLGIESKLSLFLSHFSLSWLTVKKAISALLGSCIIPTLFGSAVDATVIMMMLTKLM
jgi:hypothetical protein